MLVCEHVAGIEDNLRGLELCGTEQPVTGFRRNSERSRQSAAGERLNQTRQVDVGVFRPYPRPGVTARE